MKPISLAALVSFLAFTSVWADAADEPRRASIAAKGRELFRNTTDHCESYAKLVEFAAERAGNVGNLLEDLKYVLVGTVLTARGTGKHYIGNTAGARGDSGFKASLQDGSPQVEHSWAAIYVGKLGPGAGIALAVLTEHGFNKDSLLWVLGADTGARLSQGNYKKLPQVIRRTQCD